MFCIRLLTLTTIVLNVYICPILVYVWQTFWICCCCCYDTSKFAVWWMPYGLDSKHGPHLCSLNIFKFFCLCRARVWSSRCAGLGANLTLYMGERPLYKEQIETNMHKTCALILPYPQPSLHIAHMWRFSYKTATLLSPLQQGHIFAPYWLLYRLWT